MVAIPWGITLPKKEEVSVTKPPILFLYISLHIFHLSHFNCFMLDKPSTQGFSGGPVVSFLNPDKPICYGIIHGTRQDNTGGKLAIVVHSAYLFELIEYAKNN